jgi:hypothetical protein
VLNRAQDKGWEVAFPAHTTGVPLLLGNFCKARLFRKERDDRKCTVYLFSLSLSPSNSLSPSLSLSLSLSLSYTHTHPCSTHTYVLETHERQEV